MADQSAIEWCDSTFNPWIGCTKVSPACDHCYAETLMDTRMGRAEWGAGKPRVRTSAANWRKPTQWNRADGVKLRAWEGFKAQYPGLSDAELEAHGFVKPQRRRVFCASLADVFDNEVDPQWRRDLFNLIARCPNLDFLLLTKRIGNVIGMVSEIADTPRAASAAGDLLAHHWRNGNPPANVWLGATICNQDEADRDIPKLLAIPAAVRFVSIEPMLGPIQLDDLDGGGVDEETIPRDQWSAVDDDDSPPALGINALRGEQWQRFGDWSESCNRLDWVIAGGESGPHARPSHPDWFRSLRDQCAAAAVPFMFKQWGEWGQGVVIPGVDLGEDLRRGTARLIRPNGEDPGSNGHRFDVVMRKYGKKIAGRRIDGREHNGFPVVRQ